MAKSTAAAVKPKPKDGKKSGGKRFVRFFKDLKSEVKKVVWPTKKQVRNNTLVVLGFMAVAAVFLWILDGILGVVVRLIFG
jgi:preprotein translocase subunit SecE